jgi:hypothetical protein
MVIIETFAAGTTPRHRPSATRPVMAFADFQDAKRDADRDPDGYIMMVVTTISHVTAAIERCRSPERRSMDGKGRTQPCKINISMPLSPLLRPQGSSGAALRTPQGARHTHGASQIPIEPADPAAPDPRPPSLAAFERRPGLARVEVSVPPASETRHTSGRAHNLVASIEAGSFWGEERKSDRQPYPGRRPTIALACASIETRPLASIGTCSRTRDLSCVTSAVAIVVSIGARLGAAIVVDQ